MAIKQLEKEILQQSTEEQKRLNEIAAVTSLDFAQQAADALNLRKHLYGFEAYLILLKKEILQQSTEEQKRLNEIAAVTSLDFAQQAADALNSRKHLYGFETYLILLNELKELLYAGIPDCLALEFIQRGYNAEMWKLMRDSEFIIRR